MPHAEKLNVALSPEIASFVREVVQAGEYSSSSEVVQSALRQLKEERRDLFGHTLDELRALVQEGIDSGPPVDGPAVVERLLAKVGSRTTDVPPR